jgi:hypothetical protein
MDFIVGLNNLAFLFSGFIIFLCIPRTFALVSRVVDRQDLWIVTFTLSAIAMYYLFVSSSSAGISHWSRKFMMDKSSVRLLLNVCFVGLIVGLFLGLLLLEVNNV